MQVVIIPAYQPDGELIKLVNELREKAFSVLVVNDGSDPSCNAIFDEVARQAVVIRSPQNEGKGAALKRGFAAVKTHYPDCTHCITADADGQHKVSDICRVAQALEQGAGFVLTVRRFTGNIPARSKFGNDLSRVVYAILTGHYFDDNQSGLRGFAAEHLEWLLKVRGNKYDYEMNMLCHADKQGIAITNLPIDAIYIDGNKSSHFKPVEDTVRIYKRLFSSVWPSLTGVLLWEILTLIASIVFGYRYAHITVPTAVLFSANLTVMLHWRVAFRCIPYRDAGRTILFASVRAAIYTAISQLVTFVPVIPLFVTVNAAALLVLPLEYGIHKKMHRTIRKKKG